ncbi:hypothetical protein BDQ94DRAFT_135025 [Aspergillus welwitschiae]|uniref:Uncharacterized protein n=1 Tax=Aspergillus welwitschiae TaxID=1341132 RepID=A0A3F3QEX8_9EURO|nr:hypothetical protein BDQ94DRAFT_135025 [Aspergillus welwitschiae]RDH37793.1 hypothetical protein BDQ94DRAFT_135025 [Aspergillus welwitschiae]
MGIPLIPFCVLFRKIIFLLIVVEMSFIAFVVALQIYLSICTFVDRDGDHGGYSIIEQKDTRWIDLLWDLADRAS